MTALVDVGWCAPLCTHIRTCLDQCRPFVLLNKCILKYSVRAQQTTFISHHQVFFLRWMMDDDDWWWRQCFDTKAIWNLCTSMIGAIFGAALERLTNDSKLKELIKKSSYRRSYSIMNAGMADLASCRYDARRMRHSSYRHISIAQSIVYINS